MEYFTGDSVTIEQQEPVCIRDIEFQYGDVDVKQH